MNSLETSRSLHGPQLGWNMPQQRLDDAMQHPYAVPSSSAHAANHAAAASRLNTRLPPPALPPPERFPPHAPRSARAASPPRRVASGSSSPPSPPNPTPSPPRTTAAPSSRRALTAALELAQEAVKLDAQNDDPHGAIAAYARSVRLLSHVMNTVLRGEDEPSRRRSGRRRGSVAARQDEISRLRNIHDTYADRMNILSSIYEIQLSELSVDDAFQDYTPSRVSASESDGVDGAESIGSAMVAMSASRSSSSFSTDARSTPSPPIAHSAPAQRRQLARPASPSTPTPYPPTQSAPLNPHRTSEVPPARPPPVGPLPSRPPEHLPPAAAPPPSFYHPASFVEPDTPPIGGQWEILQARTRPSAGSGERLAALLEEEPNATRRLERSARQQGSIASLHASEDLLRINTNVSSHSNMKGTRDPSPMPSPPAREPPPRPSTPHSAHSVSQLTPRVPSSSDSHRPQSSSSRPRSRTGSMRSDASGPPPIPLMGTTASGTISQRRNKPVPPPLPITPPSATTTDPLSATSSGIGLGLAGAPYIGRISNSLPPLPHSNSVLLRSRAASQPGHRPVGPMHGQSFPLEVAGPIRPPAPPPMTPSTAVMMSRNKTSYGSGGSSSVALTATFLVAAAHNPCMPASAPPPLPPADVLRKPFHLMLLLRDSMDNRTGGFISRRLHVPQDAWRQSNGKLAHLPDKVRLLDHLSGELDVLARASDAFCGDGGPGLGAVTPGRQDGERWVARLEAWDRACENVVAELGKKLGVNDGFAMKKTSGWGKFKGSLDKMTNNSKSSDPSSYVAAMARLFKTARLLDDHMKCMAAASQVPAYATMHGDLRTQVEYYLQRSSEFFAKNVLSFVVRDLGLQLDKHAKKGEKWLTE